MQAGAVRGARIWRIGSGKHRNMGGKEFANGMFGVDLAWVRRECGKRPPKIADVFDREVGLEPRIGGQRFTAGNTAHALEHGQGRDDEHMMLFGKGREIYGGLRVGKKVG